MGSFLSDNSPSGVTGGLAPENSGNALRKALKKYHVNASVSREFSSGLGVASLVDVSVLWQRVTSPL
jgi:hypothetical protein